MKYITDTMESLMSGKLSDEQIEKFLIKLREKGETAEEITAAALVMRKHSLKTSKSFPNLLDTCGTGGDGTQTLNVSTLAAIVASSAGIQVAKHGNRSVSSVCGSADLLELLGININLPVQSVEECIEKTGFGFFFAPNFHPATKFAMPVRKKIQGKTIFNLLGPLTNPAGALHQMVGVYDQKWVEPMADVLKALGSKRALVVHGADGMDEISICAKTKIAELSDNQIKVYEVSPKDFGIKEAAASDLRCASKEEAKNAAMKVLQGAFGPQSDIISLNAAAAIYVAGKTKSIKEGLKLAKELLNSGKAKKKAEQIAEFTNK